MYTSFFAAALLVAVMPLGAQQSSYRFLVGAESEDEVALVEFVPCPPARTGTATNCGARVLRTYDVGRWVSDIEGPHGVIAAHDGRSFYVTIAHGRPYGFLRRFDIGSGRMLGEVELGMFPASVDIAPNASLLWVVNFNFEDPDMRPSSVSVVEGNTMIEVARTTTCSMPHGSRLDPAGRRHYSGCMMNDLLVEIDATTFGVSRMLRLSAGSEGAVTAADPGAHAHHDHDNDAMSAHPSRSGEFPMRSDCSPTWAQPSHDGTKVYVTCNRSAEIVEVDVSAWRVSRRWSTPAAPYNAAVTADGRLLIVTQKGPATTTIWRLSDARMLAEVPGSRRVASGVVTSSDSRFAFVTLEGIGGDPGTIDIIDLRTNARVASVDVGKQAGGIAMLP
jgi:DNA-binding beta-propeller fold protein YncE